MQSSCEPVKLGDEIFWRKNIADVFSPNSDSFGQSILKSDGSLVNDSMSKHSDLDWLEAWEKDDYKKMDGNLEDGRFF